MLFKLGNISLHFILLDFGIIQPTRTPLTDMSLGASNVSLLQQIGTRYLKTASKVNYSVYTDVNIIYSARQRSPWI